MPRLRLLPALLAMGLLAAACASDADEGSQTRAAQGLQAFVASSDLYVGAPQRVALGLVLGDGRLVSFGSVDFGFDYVGTVEEPVGPQRGPGAVAVYLPTPGTPDAPGGPTATEPSEGRGVYRADGVVFDRPGFWQVTVTANVEGLGVLRARTTIPVAEEPALPAPGQPAARTENLTLSSEGVPEAAVDSRAATEGSVPDPELHEWTIARAIREGSPALVVFSTPVYCTSRFCGPVTEMVEELSARFADRAVFIHVEIWQDFERQQITEAATDWLQFPNGDLTEPWLFLIDADGVIADRWAALWREDEVAAALGALPRIRTS